MSNVKRRRMSAYRFLKRHKSIASGRGKLVTIDLAMIPENIDPLEMIKNWNNHAPIFLT